MRRAVTRSSGTRWRHEFRSADATGACADADRGRADAGGRTRGGRGVAGARGSAFGRSRATTGAKEDQIVQRVLGDLQRQIDLMLETRMRETLTPALNRAGDALVRDLRHELASTLRDVIAHAVAQELARHRGR